jgi:hypothetical protein
MPGDAFAAESGWWRAAMIGLLVVHWVSHAGDAYGGQPQAQIPVSAFVVVSSSIAATVRLGLAPGSQTPGTDSAGNLQGGAAPQGDAAAQSNPPAVNRPKPICTAISLSCTGRSPMRVSVDDAVDEASGNVHECNARVQNNLSLCAGSAGEHNALGVTIEY